MNITDQPTQASGSRPSRRTVVKGAAWAVPAIAVAGAVPAYAAASADCTPKPVLLSGSCKLANNSAYKFVFGVGADPGCSTTGCTITIYQVSYFGSGDVLWSGTAQGGDTIVICQTPSNANFLNVTASITCGGVTGPTTVYPKIAMPQFTSNNCTEESFPACPTAAPAPKETSSTDQAPAAGENLTVDETQAAAKTQVSTDAPVAADASVAAKTQVPAKTPAAKKTLTVEATPSPTPTPTAAQ